jgi:hypothetical protein
VLGPHADVDRGSRPTVCDGIVHDFRDCFSKHQPIDRDEHPLAGIDSEALLAFLGENAE